MKLLQKQELEVTQQAIEASDELLQEYQSDLEAQARRVAKEARGNAGNALVAIDFQEADSRIRGRRKKPSYWSPAAGISLAVSVLLFDAAIRGLLGQQKWWLDCTHCVSIFALGLVLFAIGILLQARAISA